MDFLHTGLVVRDLDRMTEFYTGVLGLRVLDRIDSIAPDTGDHTGFPGARRQLVFLGFGDGHQLELVKYFEPDSPEAGCDRHERGSMHVCFQVQNIAELYERLSAQGVKFLTAPKFNRAPNGNTVGVVYFQDPEGNWLEFVQYEVTDPTYVNTNMRSPWQQPDWINRNQIILDSFAKLLGRELIDRSGSAAEQSQRLFEADFVVVAHNTADDPVLNYANRKALDLWETDLETLLSMPSRKTAEPVHRDERAELLRRVTADGYIDDYQGIRISATGKRFRIHQAIVWNLTDDDGEYAGQAATFSEWTMLGE